MPDIKNPLARWTGPALLALAPLVLLFLAAVIEDFRHDLNHGRDYALRLAQLTAERQVHLADSAEQLLFVLSRLPAVRHANVRDCVPLFVALTAQQTRFADIGLVGTDGTVLANTIPSRAPTSMSGHSWFRRASEEKTAIRGEYGADMVEGKPVLILARPVLDGAGTISSILFAAVDLGWIDRFSTQPPAPEGTVITLISPGGLVLARSVDAPAWFGKKIPETVVLENAEARQMGAIDTRGADGRERTYGFVTLPSAERRAAAAVIAGVPVKIVRSAAWAAAIGKLIALPIVLAFSALLVRWGSQFATRRDCIASEASRTPAEPAGPMERLEADRAASDTPGAGIGGMIPSASTAASRPARVRRARNKCGLSPRIEARSPQRPKAPARFRKRTSNSLTPAAE